MDLRVVTGYVAHVLLLGYWAWVLSRTAPELRRGTRDRSVRLRVLLVKTSGVALTAVLVGLIHYWATHWWQVIVAVPVATGAALWLRRVYRRLVAVPRHRMPLAQRVRRVEHRQVIPAPRGRPPAHRSRPVPRPDRTGSGRPAGAEMQLSGIVDHRRPARLHLGAGDGGRR